MLYNSGMKTQRQTEQQSVTVRLPRAMYEALKAEALREDRSIAAQLRRVLAERYGEDGEGPER